MCDNLKHVPARLPVLLRTGTDTYRRGHLISFASFQGDGEEESLFAAISRMRPGVDPDLIYRHVFVRHMGRNVSLQDILINWSPELIKTLHLNTTQGTMPEPDDEPATAASVAAAIKARWASEAAITVTSGTSTSTSANATGAAANATTATVDGKCVASESSAAAILRRLQTRHEVLKAEYDLLVEAEAVQERTRTLEQQIAAKRTSLMG